MLLGVQDVVLDPAKAEHPAQQFGSLDVSGSNQDRPPSLSQFHDLIDDCSVLCLLCFIYLIIQILPDDRTVRRNHDHIQLVDGPELPCLSLCRASHARKLMIHPEVILQGNGGECLSCRLNFHVFLRLDCLVQAIAPAAALHDTSSLFVNDFNLVVHDDVVHVFLEHRICFQKLNHGVHALALQ